MEFNEKIRYLREEKNLNQTQLGKLLNMNQMKISRMETAAAEPSLSDIRALCMFYDVSADYLLGLPKGLKHPER